MTTIHETLKLILAWQYRNLNYYEKKALKSFYEGLDGMGELKDEQVKEYLSPKQIKLIREVGKKFLITERTVVRP